MPYGLRIYVWILEIPVLTVASLRSHHRRALLKPTRYKVPLSMNIGTVHISGAVWKKPVENVGNCPYGTHGGCIVGLGGLCFKNRQWNIIRATRAYPSCACVCVSPLAHPSTSFQVRRLA